MNLKRNNNQKPNTHREIIKRYTNQPDHLPKELRLNIEKAWDGEPVQLYAMADLRPIVRRRAELAELEVER